MPSRYVVGYNATRGILTIYWRWGERPAYEEKSQEADTSSERMRDAGRFLCTCNFKFDTYTPDEMSAYYLMALPRWYLGGGKYKMLQRQWYCRWAWCS